MCHMQYMNDRLITTKQKGILARYDKQMTTDLLCHKTEDPFSMHVAG